MMNKKRQALARLAVCLSVAAELFFLSAAVYFSGRVPLFNIFVRTSAQRLVAKISEMAAPKQEAVEEPPAEPVEAAPPAPKITGVAPLFAESAAAAELADFSQEFEENGFLLKMDGDRAFSVEGDFRTLQSGVEVEGVQKSSWTYQHGSMILSRPALFADCAVFVDAKQQLAIVDLRTGTLKNSYRCGVLASGPAKIDGAAYFFAAKDGRQYSADFSGAEPEAAAEIDLMQAFAPSDAAMTAILSAVQQWLPIGAEAAQSILKSARILSPDLPEEFDVASGAPQVFVFGSAEAAKYKFSLVDENREVKKVPAVVAVFDENAQFAGSSLDGTSENPAAVCDLAAAAIYYVVAGSLSPLNDGAKCYMLASRQ